MLAAAQRWIELNFLALGRELRLSYLPPLMVYLAAGISGIGGAMFALQVGFMSPSFVGIVPSIEMVIFAAVGGRMSLVGAVYGTLLVNAGKTYFSETAPDLWLFLMAALFIGVVMAFPNGLAGLYEEKIKHWAAKRRVDLAAVPPEAARAIHGSLPALLASLGSFAESVERRATPGGSARASVLAQLTELQAVFLPSA